MIEDLPSYFDEDMNSLKDTILESESTYAMQATTEGILFIDMICVFTVSHCF